LSETLFIINPTSARGKTLKTWARARHEFVRAGLAFREHVTVRAGEAEEITRDAVRRGAGVVIAVGGDGSLSEVIRGYLDAEGRAIDSQASVGLLASGTGSDFCKSLEGTTLAELISGLVDRRTRLIDSVLASYINEAGRRESRCYINLASFGLGGDVVKFVNSWRSVFPKWVGGRTRFVLGALRALANYRCTPTEIVLDNQRRIRIESNLMVVANGKFAGGGMKLAPNAEIDDGWLDVTLTDGASRFDVIRELQRIGRGGLLENPKVSQARAKQVVVTSEAPLAIDIDGEMVGYTPATMRVLPGAVRFVGGPSKHRL
jgi:YegS/Rv2252/BmrU family lipid kinase